MRTSIKYGFIFGAIGLVINICVATYIGICGPGVALFTGGLSGFFTVREGKLFAKREGARQGAVSGAVAGGLVLIGQVLGAVGALLLLQSTGVRPIGQTVPGLSAPIYQQIEYFLGGIATGVCFGLVGILVASGIGALAGYLAAPEQNIVD